MQKQAIHFIYKAETTDQFRLDNFLAAQTGLSRYFVQINIKSGSITINGEIITKTGQELKDKDCINGFLAVPESELKPENIPLTIVYEDEHLAVINKSAGLIVHPTAYLREGTLVNALLYKYQSEGLSSSNQGERPGIVHRLDKDTSGLMVVAKNNKAHQHLAGQLQERTLKRIYWAIAIGNFKESSGTITADIGRNLIERKKMAVIVNNSSKARYARTFWEIIEQFSKAALLKISLDTGRTHQIRVHFEYIHHPLLGDPVYGGKRTQSNWIKRQALHAKEISFIHPISQKVLSFACDLPADFEFALNKLKTSTV